MSGQASNGPIKLDVRTLKIRELKDIEAAVGHKIAQELAAFDFSMDVVQGLVWIALRRQRPEATFQDAEELSFEDILTGISGPEPEPPPQPGETPSSPTTNGSPSDESSSNSEPPSGVSTPSSLSGTA